MELPDLFLELYYEYEIACSREGVEDGKPSWKKPGETAAQARDRLRAEREATKARLAASP